MTNLLQRHWWQNGQERKTWVRCKSAYFRLTLITPREGPNRPPRKRTPSSKKRTHSRKERTTNIVQQETQRNSKETNIFQIETLYWSKRDRTQHLYAAAGMLEAKERKRSRRAEGSDVQSLKKWTEDYSDSSATFKFFVGTWCFLVGKTAFLVKKRPGNVLFFMGQGPHPNGRRLDTKGDAGPAKEGRRDYCPHEDDETTDCAFSEKTSV